jgi:hypothetical protein
MLAPWNIPSRVGGAASPLYSGALTPFCKILDIAERFGYRYAVIVMPHERKRKRKQERRFVKRLSFPHRQCTQAQKNFYFLSIP